MSTTELDILKRLGKDTPENEEIYKWNVFWDAPLVVPGHERLVGPGRTEDEIKRAAVDYKSDRCTVKTDGDRVSVTFNGLTLGMFSGDLQFTVYKGSNLLRQEAVASTQAKDVAFIYKAGLKGFAIANDTKVVWRDTSQMWQENDFGGAGEPAAGEHPRAQPAGDPADGRGIAGGVSASAQVFLCARERGEPGAMCTRARTRQQLFAGRDAAGAMRGLRSVGRFAGGVEHRESTAHSQVLNCALYNAPPGTMQRMAVYYYMSATGSHATQQAVMAYTHDDVYKPVPGFKTVTGHFHLELNEMVRDRGNHRPEPDVAAGVSRAGDQHCVPRATSTTIRTGTDPGVKRLDEQKILRGLGEAEDKNFLVMPEEEANAYLDGHTGTI
jgi:hypothetical protein